jgi:hypothetical protein
VFLSSINDPDPTQLKTRADRRKGAVLESSELSPATEVRPPLVLCSSQRQERREKDHPNGGRARDRPRNAYNGALRMFCTLGVCYGWYCCMIERVVSPWTTIQTPLSSGSNNFRLLVPLTMWTSWETVIGVPAGAFVITVT